MTDSVKRAAFCETRLFVEATGLVIVNYRRRGQTFLTARCSHTSRAAGKPLSYAMADESKCPLGRHAWLATFLVVAFVLLFVSRRLGLL